MYNLAKSPQVIHNPRHFLEAKGKDNNDRSALCQRWGRHYEDELQVANVTVDLS